MKTIQLSKGQVALVDDDDFNLLSKRKWYFANYAYTKIGRKNLTMQSIIIGRKDGFLIDHINRNKIDNRKENLRHVTVSQNRMNSAPKKNCKSGYKGVTYVSWRASPKKWKVSIKIGDKLKTTGWYKTAEEAALAYNIIAKQVNGDYAYLNTI